MSSSMHAVLVGVDEYDDSTIPNLKGALNDVRRWYATLTNHLGLLPQNILVVTSPVMTAADLGVTGAAAPTFVKADYQGMVQGIDYLGARMAADKDCIFTFSGHGATSAEASQGSKEQGQGLALAPSGTNYFVDGEIAGLVSFDNVQNWLNKHTENGELTVFIDACYSKAQSGGRGLGAPPNGKQPEIFSRLFTACQQWETAHEMSIAGRWYGAFTWAITSLIDRWARVPKDTVFYLDASHNDLAFRTRELLDVLGVPQIPRFAGIRSYDDLPVFYPGREAPMGTTSPVPNGHLIGEELDGGIQGFAVYLLHYMDTAGKTHRLGSFLSTSKDAVGDQSMALNNTDGSPFLSANLFSKKTEYVKIDWSKFDGIVGDVTCTAIINSAWEDPDTQGQIAEDAQKALVDFFGFDASTSYTALPNDLGVNPQGNPIWSTSSSSGATWFGGNEEQAGQKRSGFVFDDTAGSEKFAWLTDHPGSNNNRPMFGGVINNLTLPATVATLVLQSGDPGSNWSEASLSNV